MTNEAGPTPAVARGGRPRTNTRRLALAAALIGACAVGAGAAALAQKERGVSFVALSLGSPGRY